MEHLGPFDDAMGKLDKLENLAMGKLGALDHELHSFQLMGPKS